MAAAKAGFRLKRSPSIPACLALCAMKKEMPATQMITRTRQPPSPPKTQANVFDFLGGTPAGAPAPGIGGTGGLVAIFVS